MLPGKMPNGKTQLGVARFVSFLLPFPLRLPRLRRFPNLGHQLVERFVVTPSEGSKGVWPLQESFLDRLRHSLRKDQQFLLVGFQSISEAVNQRIGRVIAEIQPLVLDPAQVSEDDIDLRSQIPKASLLRGVVLEFFHRMLSQVRATAAHAGCWAPRRFVAYSDSTDTPKRRQTGFECRPHTTLDTSLTS